MKLFKLTEQERNYPWHHWLGVAFRCVCHPIAFIEYVRWRRWTDREGEKTMEQKRAEMRAIREGLEDELAKETMWRK